MSFIRSFLLAFSMFSRLPVPTVKWHDDSMRYMLVFFPFVGAVVGLFVWGWLYLCTALDFGIFLRAAGLTLLPVAVTGGIHIDGFCDTVDALASHAPQERKREILKDPHTGAFAVISIASYLILYFSLAAELKMNAATPLLLGLSFVLSRTLSGLSVLLFPAVGSQGLLASFKGSAHKTVSVLLLLILFSAATTGLLMTNLLSGGAMILTAFLCFLYLYIMSRRQFGGMSGDLAGYFLQISEIGMLAALIIISKVVTA